MPVPPCLVLADRVFPRVRALAARRLVADGWSQSRTAEALGVSQAMVSKYAARDDGADPDPLVARLADELVAELGRPAGAATPAAPAAPAPSPWCVTLTSTPARPGGEAALHDLLAAEARLLAANPTRLVPEIGMNLARALPDAAGPEDVLAFPGRLVDAGGRLVRPAPPAFGASGHLAACLLALRRSDPGVHALASVRGGEHVAGAAAAAAGAVATLEGDDSDRAAAFEAALRSHHLAQGAPPALLHDPGAVGIEACLYVAGRDAAEVADRILLIHGGLPP